MAADFTAAGLPADFTAAVEHRPREEARTVADPVRVLPPPVLPAQVLLLPAAVAHTTRKHVAFTGDPRRTPFSPSRRGLRSLRLCVNYKNPNVEANECAIPSNGVL